MLEENSGGLPDIMAIENAQGSTVHPLLIDHVSQNLYIIDAFI